jgi:hypothetical protein
MIVLSAERADREQDFDGETVRESRKTPMS